MDKNNTARCLIFGAGDYTDSPQPCALCADSLVIAADGGYKYLDSIGITPDIYIGDYDSSERPDGVGAVQLPIEKDDTDMLAAVRLALSRGCREIHMFGGTGGRLDHTLANIQTLRFITERGGCGYLYGSGCAMTVLSGERVTLPSRTSGEVSLFALERSVRGVTISGLKYTLENGEITDDFPIGVSNSYIGCRTEITVSDGCALLYYVCGDAAPLKRERVDGQTRQG